MSKTWASYTLESHIRDHSRDRVVTIHDTRTADGVRCCDGWYQSGSGAEGGLQESCQVGLTNGKNPVMFSGALIKLDQWTYRPSCEFEPVNTGMYEMLPLSLRAAGFVTRVTLSATGLKIKELTSMIRLTSVAFAARTQVRLLP